MTAQGLQPSIVAYNTLLASCAHRGAWGDALEALTCVLAAQPEGVNPNTSAGGGRACGWGSDGGLVGGLPPATNHPCCLPPTAPRPTATFNSCLAALAKGAAGVAPAQAGVLAARALQVFAQLRATAGCAPDAASYAHLVKALHATGQHQQVGGSRWAGRGGRGRERGRGQAVAARQQHRLPRPSTASLPPPLPSPHRRWRPLTTRCWLRASPLTPPPRAWCWPRRCRRGTMTRPSPWRTRCRCGGAGVGEHSRLPLLPCHGSAAADHRPTRCSPLLPPRLPQVQGVQLEAPVLAHLLRACVTAGAFDLGLQLCNAALVAQARVACGGWLGI